MVLCYVKIVKQCTEIAFQVFQEVYFEIRNNIIYKDFESQPFYTFAEYNEYY